LAAAKEGKENNENLENEMIYIEGIELYDITI
jgi:hypothetical protein